jgi:hypothetical protein
MRFVSVYWRPGRARMHAPLRDDDAAFAPLDAAPHPAALLEVLGACVDRVERRRLGLAPVGDEAPSHGVHDERGLLRARAADDGGVCARRDVVPGHVAVSVHPLVDVERGVVVELLDLVCLFVCFCLRKRKKLPRGLTWSASANLPHMACLVVRALVMPRHGGPVRRYPL